MPTPNAALSNLNIPVSEAFPPPDPFPVIEAFPNAFAGREFPIQTEFPEFTSVCPKTGLPDFGTIVITYIPNWHCLELKSLKYYLLAYRNYGIFYENVVNRILNDVVKATEPKFAEVTGKFSARGGLNTTITVRYHEAPNAAQQGNL
ncbi:MAG: preQ(1) synthase [Vampirovibrionales bacterium]|nr:preQ(1) synthase [Vampirovibrionales bacterium]